MTNLEGDYAVPEVMRYLAAVVVIPEDVDNTLSIGCTLFLSTWFVQLAAAGYEQDRRREIAA